MLARVPERVPSRTGLAARLAKILQSHWWRAKPSWLSWALLPLSALYAGLASVQQRRALKRRVQLPVPVVVVGNWVVGGAGKTPTVVALVQALQAAGWQPGILSRGYGARTGTAREVAATDHPRSVGDEPVLMRRRTQAPVWVGRDRVAAAQGLLRQHPTINVLVSDDGLQHRALPRNAEVIVFDERGAGNGLLLPAGPLREALPAATLEPQQVVLYTSGTASTALAGAFATRQSTQAWPLTAWQAGDSHRALPLVALRDTPLLAVAGLAAPEKFFNMLAAAGLHIRRLPLADHFAYTSLPWPADTAHIITTEKDAVKLLGHALGSTCVWVVPLDLVLPQAFVENLLLQLRSTRATPTHHEP
jgi:tetraacyldisaccharide 4'-kinase